MKFGKLLLIFPVGCHVPIASIQNQSVRALVFPGTEIEAADHRQCCEKLVQCIMQLMNNIPDLGKSLFSRGSNGNGQAFVSIHDVTLIV